MSEVDLHPHHVFGLRTAVRNNLHFVDEQTILFPCGNNCTRYHIHLRGCKFITGTERSRGMRALALSPNWRYLAVSEHAERGAIAIYDLQHEQSRKKKVLTAGDVSAQEFVWVAFSPDSKFLLGQGGGPDWTLVYWLWEKNKVLATVKSTNTGPIYQVSFNPQDSTQVCVSGNGAFKLFRYVDGVLKQTNSAKLETQNILSHAWMSEERVIAGTETGRLLVFESGDLRWETSVSSRRTDQEMTRQAEDEFSPSLALMPRVTAIKAYSKGFACSAGPGTVCLFEKTEENTYRQIREIRIPPDPCSNEPNQAQQQEISSMSISPSEDTLAASTDRGQIYAIALASAEMTKGTEAHFEFLSHSFHSGSINGLSVCIRKPIIATCSADRSVRVWNYHTGDLELYKEFQEEVYSVALHPSGLFILAGFSDKLRLMNLLIDDIRTFKEFTVRSCRECVFSHGGHMFSAVNGNVIHLFSTTTFDNVLNLKGHSGKVRSVAWRSDDSRLVSCGMDGAVYEWNALSGQRESESVLKSCSYTGVALPPDSSGVVAVGSDCTLKEIHNCQILKEVSSEGMIYTAVVMTRSGRAIFTGTSSGTIRSFKYPLVMQKDWKEYQAHSAPVTKLAITFDERYLLSASEDGCLFIWRIEEQEGRGLKREKETSFAEEILITKSDLEEKNQVMLELRTRVEEMKMESEYQLRLKDMNYSEKIKELTEKFIQQIESLTNQNQVLSSERENQAIEHQVALKDIVEKHSKEQQDSESTNTQKLMLEYEKHQELQVKLQKMQEGYEEKLQDMEEIRQRALEDVTLFYENKLQEKIRELGQRQDECQQQLREFEEIRKQTEEDGDMELHDVRVTYERRLWEEKETNLKLGGETRVMKKKFASLQNEIDNRNLEIEKLKAEQQKLHGVIKALEKDIMGLKREIQERDETIQDKENRIYDLKKKNEELEKFKFVLEYKVNELKKQIEPRENEVKDMKEQVHEMDAELEQFCKKNVQLELTISEMKLKLKAADKERKKESQRVRDVEGALHRFKTDLHNCMGFIQEPKKLKESVREIYERYVQQSDVVEIDGVDADVQREYTRQREHMEKNMEMLRKRLAKENKVHEDKNIKLMKENVSLIKEINDLRAELRLLQAQIHEDKTPNTFSKNKSRNITCVKPSSSSAPPPNTKSDAQHHSQRLRQQLLNQGQSQGEDQDQSFFIPNPPSNIKLPSLTT